MTSPAVSRKRKWSEISEETRAGAKLDLDGFAGTNVEERWAKAICVNPHTKTIYVAVSGENATVYLQEKCTIDAGGVKHLRARLDVLKKTQVMPLRIVNGSRTDTSGFYSLVEKKNHVISKLFSIAYRLLSQDQFHLDCQKVVTVPVAELKKSLSRVLTPEQLNMHWKVLGVGGVDGSESKKVSLLGPLEATTEKVTSERRGKKKKKTGAELRRTERVAKKDKAVGFYRKFFLLTATET